MIQKSRARLFFVGVLFLASNTLALRFPVLKIPCVVASLTGIYLLVWALAGKGRWCRECKTFRIFQAK
jgi:hypothetical protein